MQSTDPEATDTREPPEGGPFFLGEHEPAGEAPPAEAEPEATAPPVQESAADAAQPEGPKPALGALLQDPGQRRLLFAAGIVALVLLLVPLLLFWQVRRDTASLRSEVDGLRFQAKRSEVLLQKATILRARAELQALRQTLPADLSLEVEKADGILSGVDGRLKATP